MGLKRIVPGSRLKGSQNKLFNIFNGQEYVFQESEWQAVTLARLLWRYGTTYFRSAPLFEPYLFVHKQGTLAVLPPCAAAEK